MHACAVSSVASTRSRAVRSFAPLDERYFGEMCFYSDAHDALLRNKGALLDPHAFGEAFDASLEAMDAWQTVRHSTRPP